MFNCQVLLEARRPTKASLLLAAAAAAAAAGHAGAMQDYTVFTDLSLNIHILIFAIDQLNAQILVL